MQETPLVRADLITGILLVVFGAAVVAASLGMPRLEERNIDPWTVPGLVPGLLGLVIATLGAVLALRSALAGALSPRIAMDEAETAEARANAVQLALCGALCLIYAVGLLGRVPFWLATGLFVFAFIAVFEWDRSDAPSSRAKKLGIAAALAVTSAVAIPYLFESVFLVRLP